MHHSLGGRNLGHLLAHAESAAMPFVSACLRQLAVLVRSTTDMLIGTNVTNTSGES
jgi:hypothetical protein